jgi:hypothetical protein
MVEGIKSEFVPKLSSVAPTTTVGSISSSLYRQKYFSCKCIITYLLTPWSRVPLEKLTGFASSQEIPRLFGT